MSMNKPDMEQIQRTVATSLHEHWMLYLVEGIVLVVLGLAAIVIPPIATLAAEILFGWLFVISGIVGLITTFRMRQAPGFWWSLISAIIGIAAGVTSHPAWRSVYYPSSSPPYEGGAGGGSLAAA